jgi:hypothetical protein
MQEPDHRRYVDERLADKEEKVGVWHVLEKIPFPHSGLTSKLKENFIAGRQPARLRMRKSTAFETGDFPA